MKLINIETIEEINYDGEVIDLTIDEDSSYTVEGYVVHNCCCITSSNTAIGYPIASLISEVADIKMSYLNLDVPYDSLPKIVADGGVRNYSDVIKAIALGADYVMCGSIFSQMIESAAFKFMSVSNKNIPLRFPIERYKDLKCENGKWSGTYTDDFIKYLKESGRTEVDEKEKVIGSISAKIYGMASKAGQIAMNGEKKRTSEGVEKTVPVLYTMKTWVENMTDYLRSAMSYTDSRTLYQLRQANVEVISKNTFEAVNR